MSKSYLAYTRVSTAKQGEGVSLEVQRDAILRYAERQNLAIVQWFEEKETAAKRGRPVFGEMLKLLENGQARGVIIHKIDRSARNLKDWANLGELIDVGVEVHFANESLDLHSRGGRLSADIQAVVAADYIRNLREETRKGFYGRLKQGVYPLPAPLGYVDNGKGQVKTIHPVTGPLVRQAFELYAGGQFSLDQLGMEMYRRGLRNRRGGKVSRTGLSTILNNPFYIGIVRLRSTGETFSGAHEPLIEKRVFDRVQLVIRGKTQKGSGKHAFVFRRLFRCAACGYALIGERQKGHTYYRCHTRGCPTTGIRQETLESGIVERFRPLALTPPELVYLLHKVEALKVQWQASAEDRKRNQELRLAKIQDRLKALTDAFLDGLLEKDLFEERKEALLRERGDIRDFLGNPEQRAPTPEKLKDFLELAGSAYSSYKVAIDDEKRDFLETVTSNRLVREKNVEITLKEPFRLIAERAQLSYSAPSRARARTLDKLLRQLTKYFKENEVVIPERSPQSP